MGLMLEKKLAEVIVTDEHHGDDNHGNEHFSDQLTYEQVAEAITELGHRMMSEDESADVWEIASGMMAGAVQFWLYSRQPCSDPFCHVCSDISTPDKRVEALLREARALCEESDYYRNINDVTTGTA